MISENTTPITTQTGVTRKIHFFITILSLTFLLILHYKNNFDVFGKGKILPMNWNKDKKDKKGNYIRQERYAGAMSRSFFVGDAVTQDEVVENKNKIAIEG